MKLPDTSTYTDFRKHLAEHLKRIRRAGRPTMVTQNGKVAAVVLSPEQYESLAEGASTARTLEKIERALSDIRRGRTVPLEKAAQEWRKKYGITARRAG